MSLSGKNRKVFSYNNKCKRECNFRYKDFEKTKSYHSDFGKANFDFVSFRAAHMKFCNFNGASFVWTEFVGSNLRGSSFKGAIFKDSIFMGTVLDKTDFSGASFENCVFYVTKHDGLKGMAGHEDGINIIFQKPAVDAFSPELINVIQELRSNDIIRRSHTLHTKKNGVNIVYLNELLKIYKEDELIKLLPNIPDYVKTQFYTLSYLQILLKKVRNNDSI